MRRYCTREKNCGDKYCTREGENGCPFEYNEALHEEAYRYKGPDWPPPRRWIADNGTIVYRSFADYVD
jgi:hypothetical protein